MGFIADMIGATNNQYASSALPAGYQSQNFSEALKAALNNFQAPAFNQGQANQTAGQQDALVAALNNQMNGQGPSVAQNQLNQSLAQNQADTASQIASVRGMNPATAARLILNNQAQQAGQAAGQGALLRAQETQNVQSQLGSLLANKRAQDITQAGTAADVGLQGLNAQTSRIGSLGGLQNQANANLLQNKLGVEGTNAQIAAQNAKTNAGIAGGLLGGAASAAGLAMSDGGFVPGPEFFGGDDPKNDVVPAMLSPGEIVIPKSQTTPDKAAEFVAALKEDDDQRKMANMDYGSVLNSQRILHQRLANLEKMAHGGMVGMARGGIC